MNYKEKYEMALEGIQEILGSGEDSIKMSRLQLRLQGIFPELKESEDEKVRKEIIDFLKLPHPQFVGKRDHEKWIAWLEKQAEKKPILDFKAKDWYVSKVDGKIHNIYHSVDKVKPIFKVGDWLVHNERKHIIKVVNHTPLVYEVVNILGHHHTITNTAIENNYHLWTIRDAKDGDVLVGSYGTFIFVSKSDGYCGVLSDNTFIRSTGNNEWTEDLHPAAKEQRNLLFQKMNETGYEWDFKKKELKKIEDEHQLKEGKFYECIKSYYYLGGGQYWFDKGSVYFCEKDGYLRLDSNNNIYVYDCKNWQNYFRPYAEKLAWSEEDERMYRGLHNLIYSTPYCDSRKELSDFLNSLKDRVQPQNHWKPTFSQCNIHFNERYVGER